MTEIVETGHVEGEDEPHQPFQVIYSRTCLPLWRFLRHHSPRLAAEQAATSQRHAQLRVQIKAELEAGRRYPWALLARLHAPKFYSDIVESLLGAIWVDSGSLDACQDVLEGIGALPYLRRLVADGVQAWHPKEEIGVLAGNLPVQYVVEAQKSGAVDDDKREFTCSVLMGETVVVRVGGGVSSEEVKTRGRYCGACAGQAQHQRQAHHTGERAGDGRSRMMATLCLSGRCALRTTLGGTGDNGRRTVPPGTSGPQERPSHVPAKREVLRRL